MVERTSGGIRDSWFKNDFKSKFDFLTKHFKVVLSQSSSTLDHSKSIKTSLSTSNHVLQKDFSREEIEFWLDDETGGAYENDLRAVLNRLANDI